ncbi:BZ3500_MvSof-1268-A1-R1_Chr12-2g03743 [Microbotryum saponariae]|uniref:BZ3500_MvSof-1268-A1-R1_Chr12-2g03743 protein n=1 Tax=Microbotryum saponariae TaxID=289078 RepID=A0A2X0KKV3_9BASI|nr:BZ3500_MvSof-1268-A1-R1_Chr12-2g03743 [Microbotryum saponariae]
MLTTNVPSAKSELPELLDVLRITREAMTLDIPTLLDLGTSLPELASDGLANIVFGQGDLSLKPGSPWARENLTAFGQREANRIAAEVVLLAMQVHKVETQPGKRRASLATLSQRMTKNRIFAHWAREVGIVEELKRFGGPTAKPLVKTLAADLQTFIGALSLVQGSSAPTFVLAPLILREYKRMVGFVDSPTADSDSVTDGARAPFKSWVPNTISATDYQDIQMALQDLNKSGGTTKVRTPRAKRAVKEPAAVKTSAFSVSRAFETINAFSAFKTMYDVFVRMIEMLGDK